MSKWFANKERRARDTYSDLIQKRKAWTAWNVFLALPFVQAPYMLLAPFGQGIMSSESTSASWPKLRVVHPVTVYVTCRSRFAEPHQSRVHPSSACRQLRQAMGMLPHNIAVPTGLLWKGVCHCYCRCHLPVSSVLALARELASMSKRCDRLRKHQR